MNTWFADTYFFIALLVRDDEAHELATRSSRDLANSLITTEWVLTEVGDALSAARERPRFRAFIDFLRAHPLISIVPANSVLFDAGIELYDQRPDKSWSLTDCISFIVMQQHHLTEALTGDRHFEQAGFAALLKNPA